MNWTKFSLPQLKCILIAAWIPVSLMSCSTLSLAQTDHPVSNRSKQIPIRFIPAKPDPPDKGTPTTDQGTGSRGDCLYKKDFPPLTSLVGGKNLALTADEHPQFWVYVPYTPQEAPSGEFSLQDGENEVYRTRFQLPATPGIVSISLPSTAKSLEVGKTYRWYFDINCPRSQSSDQRPASLTGVVQRVAPSSELENELKAAKTPLERIAAFAQHHIWFNALTEFALLRQKESQNPTLKSAWVELLSDQNVGLEKVAQEPISGSVTANSQSE